MDDILKTPNGANFLLADLHIHTPKDPRFRESLNNKYNLSKVEEKKRFIRDFFSFAMNERGLSILAITEHNDVSYLNLYKAVKKEKPFRKLILFPGVEVSSREGIHLLVLFNPDEQVETIDGFLSEIGLTPGHRVRGKTVLPSDRSFDEILNLLGTKYVTKTNEVEIPRALAIAAHLDQDNGLGKQKNAKLFYQNPYLLAVQITKPYSELRDGYKNILSGKYQEYGFKAVAVVESSDCRSLEEVGKYASYLKMSSPTIEGLKQAFLDTESRLRHKEEKEEHSYSRILAAKWEGGFVDGLSIHFNNNINCLIGGKGTGKSTVIETLRYAFGLEPRSAKGQEQHQELLKSVFRSGSKVSVLIESRDFNNCYIISRTYPYQAVVTDVNGNPVSMAPKDILPHLEIYGQKEIYEISNNREFQLELINRFLGQELDELKKQEKELLQMLTTNKVDILKLKQELENKEDSVAELPRLKEQLKKYKESRIEEKLAEKRIYEKERDLMEKTEQKLELFSELLEDFAKELDLDVSYLDEAHLKGLLNEESFRTIRNLIRDFATTVDKSFISLQEQLTEVKNRVEEQIVAWEELYQAQEMAYQKKLKILQKESDLDPDDFIKIERKIQQLDCVQKNIEKDQKHLEELYQYRQTLLNRLYEIRRKIFQKSEEVCKNRINQKLEGILTVELQFEGEKTAFVEKLLELHSGAQRRQIETIVQCQNFSIPQFVNAVRTGVSELVNIYRISPSSAEKLYKSLDEEMLLDLEWFEIPTRTIISLNTGTPANPNFKDTDHLSVGQKCTAILTLILLESPYPLIIDQPEDDLDNSFIFDDIVKKLRAEKERRQFIIATHNANIPVLGDAEEIIVLEATDEKILVDQVKVGSIDDCHLKEPVERILEGGKQAFELRKLKYGF